MRIKGIHFWCHGILLNEAFQPNLWSSELIRKKYYFLDANGSDWIILFASISEKLKTDIQFVHWDSGVWLVY